jgi:Protein of unknown function (DUF3089)
VHSEFGDQYVAVTPEVDDPVTEGRDRTEECIRRYNKGRGIVFLGHSQGTSRLIELLRRQIDKRPDMRKRLVSAILLGGNVTVRAGSDRGGVFANIPACRTSRQTGCVIAFSTFNTTPPDETRYGKGDNRYASLSISHAAQGCVCCARILPLSVAELRRLTSSTRRSRSRRGHSSALASPSLECHSRRRIRLSLRPATPSTGVAPTSMAHAC